MATSGRHTHTHRQIHLFRITSQIARITFISPSGLPAAVRVHSLVVPAETFREVPRLPNHRYPLPACSAGSTTTSAVTWLSTVRRGCTPSTFFGCYRPKALLFMSDYAHIFRVEVFGAPCWTQYLSPTADSCPTSHPSAKPTSGPVPTPRLEKLSSWSAMPQRTPRRWS